MCANRAGSGETARMLVTYAISTIILGAGSFCIVGVGAEVGGGCYAKPLKWYVSNIENLFLSEPLWKFWYLQIPQITYIATNFEIFPDLSVWLNMLI